MVGRVHRYLLYLFSVDSSVLSIPALGIASNVGRNYKKTNMTKYNVLVISLMIILSCNKKDETIISQKENDTTQNNIKLSYYIVPSDSIVSNYKKLEIVDFNLMIEPLMTDQMLRLRTYQIDLDNDSKNDLEFRTSINETYSNKPKGTTVRFLNGSFAFISELDNANFIQLFSKGDTINNNCFWTYSSITNISSYIFNDTSNQSYKNGDFENKYIAIRTSDSVFLWVNLTLHDANRLLIKRVCRLKK
jgi:hypothetical protein